MDAFGEDPNVSAPPADDAAPGSDPAADFLAREQEELGDLGQELGIDGTTVGDPVVDDDLAAGVADVQLSHTEESEAEIPATISQPRVEPETIRKWRLENEQRLLEKDEEEQKKMEELREQAKKELGDWYKHYEEQLAKTKATNRETEKEFVAEVNDITPGSEWERVNKLVDFNTKNNKNSKDMSRMRSILLQLKQNPSPRQDIS